MTPKVLVVDHRDSFVFNLFEDLRRLGATVDVVRSSIPLAGLERRLARTRPDLVVLSPGPGGPDDSGVMLPWLRTEPRRPVLGVCLGMQVMGRALGGEVGRAPHPVHGRPFAIVHDGHPLFRGIGSPFAAGRYHSLVLRTMPSGLRAIAECAGAQGGPLLPMAVAGTELPWIGVQFHPESVLTPEGPSLLANALALAQTHAPTHEGARNGGAE